MIRNKLIEIKTKFLFKIASWLLRRHEIIAPELLEHTDGRPVRTITILTPKESEELIKT